MTAPAPTPDDGQFIPDDLPLQRLGGSAPTGDRIASERSQLPKTPLPDDIDEADATVDVSVPPVTAYELTLRESTRFLLVTPALIAANVIMCGVMALSGVNILQPTNQAMIEWGADFAPVTLDGQWWRIVVSLFVHGNLLVLALNMWALWVAGQVLERLLGNVGFAIIYFASGSWANLATHLIHVDVISAGAAPSIFGVWSALGAFYLRNQRILPPEVIVRLRNGVVSFMVMSLILSVSITGTISAGLVASIAAGFLLGLVVGGSLGPAAVAARPKNNLIAAAIGGVVALALAVALPAPQQLGGVVGALTRFAKVEREVMTELQQNQQKVLALQMNDAELIRRLRDDLLPSWRECEKGLQVAPTRNPQQQAHVGKVLRYMQLRREGWEILIEAVEQNNNARVNEARAKQEQADQLARELANQKN